MLREFVKLAEKREDSFAALCARFGVSRKTGYKWLKRYRALGEAGLQRLSRRPKSSPRRTPDDVVDAVLALRLAHPDWSASRLREELARQGVAPQPAPSTIDLILRRQRESLAAPAAPAGPNSCWIFALSPETTLADGTVAIAVVVRDEHTSFIVGSTLLVTRWEETLAAFTRGLLQRHGLPERILFPRPPELRDQPGARAHTPHTIALMQLGIAVDFSFDPPAVVPAARRQLADRLAHLPAYQVAALAERLPAADPLVLFHDAAARLTVDGACRLLQEARERHNFRGREDAQQGRNPIALYRPSPRRLTDEPTVATPAPGADVRLISEKGIFTFKRRLVHVGRPFARIPIEVRPTPHPERFLVLLAGHALGTFNLSMTPVDSTASLQLSKAC